MPTSAAEFKLCVQAFHLGICTCVMTLCSLINTSACCNTNIVLWNVCIACPCICVYSSIANKEQPYSEVSK